MTAEREILSLNRFDESRAQLSDAKTASLVARRSASFGSASVLFYDEPIVMERAQGVWMFGADGKRYLDMYNNVPSVGHCHPHVVEAMVRQVGLLSTHSRYLYDVAHTYAERLLAYFPGQLSNLLMTCTGSESNDLALRMAREYSGGTGFVVTETAYHGNTASVTEVSPSSLKSGQIPPHVRAVPAPTSGGDVGGIFAAHVTAAIDDLARNGIRFAGLLADTIFSSDGIYADPPGFLQEAVEATHRAGGLFIADEVQPGFGRTGGLMWGFERHQVAPDIVTLGKPMGNGYPMGGVVTRPEILSRFCEQTGYFNTFGGSPVAAATGLAVLEVIESENLLEHARKSGAFLKAGLEGVVKGNDKIREVRGAGLFIGVELREGPGVIRAADNVHSLINALKAKGILIGSAGARGETLKIRPPLCFSLQDGQYFLEIFESVLKSAR